MCAIVAGILIASYVIGQDDGRCNPDVDAFPASRAWLYVAIVGFGYMVSIRRHIESRERRTE